jgi:PAS domain S-box-containing protein
MDPITTPAAVARPARAYVIALACVAVATVVRWLLQPVLGPNLQFITYFPAVFLSAAVGGFGPTLLTTVLSGLLAEYLFFMPPDRFNLGEPVALAGLMLFSLTGIGIGWLGQTRLRAVAHAQREAAEARRLEQVAEESAISAEEAAAQAEEEALRADNEAARARAALEEAHAAHERTRAVLDSTTDAYIGMNSEWRITVVNRQAAAALQPYGIDAARLPGRTMWEIWPNTLGTEVERQYRRVMSERVPTTFEHWYPAYQRWYEIHAYPTTDGGLAVYFRDITDRKQAEALLREAEETYRALAELSPEAILVKQDRRYVFVNHAAARLCAAKNEQELIGRTPYEFLDAESQEAVRARVRRVLDDHVPASALQCRWQRLDGLAVEVELAAAPLTWRGKPAVQLVLRDLTERKRIDERLQQTQRMDAIGRLAGGVAHEVNNQMTVVLGTAEFLLRRPDLPDWARSDLDSIRRAAQGSAAVTSQLLSFSRRQLLNPRPLDLNAAVAEIAPILQRTLGPAIRLERSLQAELGTVVIDHGQFTQALLNLALNARDAMGVTGGGVVRIESSVVQVLPGNALDDGTEAAPGSYVTLRLSDTGVGMDRTTMSRVFEPFFTTKPVGQGTGLGLAMVYGMVRQSHGYVTVESQPGVGSAFTIYLPQVNSTAEAVSVASPLRPGPAVPHSGAPRLAVVVEDEATVRDVVVRVLRDEGFQVMEASDGATALGLISQMHPDAELQLVVTDLAMPLMGGRELAERLRATGHQVPLLFISGYTDEDIDRLGLIAIGEEVLRKPFSPTMLAERIRQLTANSKQKADV